MLEREGIPREELLAAAELPRTLFDDPDARITYEMAGRLVRVAVAHTRHHALGIEAAKYADTAQFHLLEYLTASASRVESALEDLVRYQGVMSDARIFALERDGGDLVLRYQPPIRPPRVIVEYVLAGLVQSARRSFGRRGIETRVRGARVASVCFAYPAPKSARDEYEKFFGPSLVFDAPCDGLRISGVVLDRKMARANPIAHDALEAQVKAQVRGEIHTRAVSERARALVAEALPDGDLSQDAIARKLGVSRTTLKRRLAEEGTSLRALVDDVRKETALRALRQPSLSVGDVAYRAGYEDATAFNKAFKRWTGETPAEHRARMRRQG